MSSIPFGRQPTTSPAKERKQVGYSSTPGHRRTSLQGVPKVASLKPPVIAPRTNSAASARLAKAASGQAGQVGQVATPSPERGDKALFPSRSTVASPTRTSPTRSTVALPTRTSTTSPTHTLASTRTRATSSQTSISPSKGQRERKEVDFSCTPGHRRQWIQGMSKPASLKQPAIAPRLNASTLTRLERRKSLSVTSGTDSPSRATSRAVDGRQSVMGLGSRVTSPDTVPTPRSRAPPPSYRRSMALS